MKGKICISWKFMDNSWTFSWTFISWSSWKAKFTFHECSWIIHELSRRGMEYLIILVGHYDLYFTVQWFYLIAPTLFYGFTSYMGYWFSMTLWEPHNTYWPLGPILHGLVILLNTFNSILWIYSILWILVHYDTMSELIVLIGQYDLILTYIL